MSYTYDVFGNRTTSLLPAATDALIKEQSSARQKRIADAIAERKREEEADRKAAQERREARGRAELEQYQETAKAAWLANGGDAAGFARNWPAMRDEWLKQRIAQRLTNPEVQAAKAKLAATGAYNPM